MAEQSPDMSEECADTRSSLLALYRRLTGTQCLISMDDSEWSIFREPLELVQICRPFRQYIQETLQVMRMWIALSPDRQPRLKQLAVRETRRPRLNRRYARALTERPRRLGPQLRPMSTRT